MSDLVAGKYPIPNPNYLLNGSPTGLFRESLPRHACAGNTAAVGTGVMLSVALPLVAGDLVTNLTFRSATTAAGTPTNWWFALYDDAATPALLAQTADQLTAAWAANTVKTLALATPQRIPRTGIYYAACMVTATTPPTLFGNTLHSSAAVLSGQKVLAQSSGSSLTGTAPATIASPTAVVGLAYAVAT
jgi:hypothetical protein